MTEILAGLVLAVPSLGVGILIGNLAISGKEIRQRNDMLDLAEEAFSRGDMYAYAELNKLGGIEDDFGDGLPTMLRWKG